MRKYILAVITLSLLIPTGISTSNAAVKAGAAQENVKHPKALINKLNHVVIPDYANLLISLHENSEITRFSK